MKPSTPAKRSHTTKTGTKIVPGLIITPDDGSDEAVMVLSQQRDGTALVIRPDGSIGTVTEFENSNAPAPGSLLALLAPKFAEMLWQSPAVMATLFPTGCDLFPAGKATAKPKGGER